jgi:hypothetical protein
MAHRGAQIQGAVCLVAVEEDRNRGNRDVGADQDGDYRFEGG